MNSGSTGSTSVPLVVGITGHRDLVAAEVPQIRSRVEGFFADLRAQFPDLPIMVLHGVAEGADMLVAQAARDMGCEVINVLPMPADLYAEDFSTEGLSRFRNLLAEFESVELPLLSPQAKASGPQRDMQYEQLGAFLAAHSHILLALWDGKYNTAVGGTGQVVDFHQRDISALADDQIRSQLDVTDDESDLVYHVVCSRQAEGAPATGLVPGTAFWFTRDHDAPRVEQMPPRYVAVFDQLQTFNRDIQALPTHADFYYLEPRAVQGPAQRACSTIQQMFGISDALASRFQRRVLWALRTTLVSTVLAGLCFIVYADFDDQAHFIWGYFTFVLLALASYFVAYKRDWQRRYLDYRVLAEALRVQYYWALGGVEMTNPSRYSHDSFFQGRDLQLGWIRNVMRVTGLYADANVEPDAQDLADAIEGWVGDEQSGQLGYYRNKAADKLHKHRQTGKVTAAAFILGLCAAAVLALAGEQLSGSSANWLVAIMGLLPIVAAARQNYAHRVAERELAAQYGHMLKVFENAHRLLHQSTSSTDKQRVLRDLGEAALNENAQWVLRQRERPLPGGESVG